MTHARSENDIFENDFKGKYLSTYRDFGEWKRDRWSELADIYQKLSFQVLPIAHHKKRPEAGTSFSEPLKGQETILSYLETSSNLAVLGGDQWVILDVDRHDLPFSRDLSLTWTTPRGYTILTSEPFSDVLFEEVEKCYRDTFDTPRRGTWYSLLPPSVTCSLKHEYEGRELPKHEGACDWRVREIVSKRIIVKSFDQFCIDILKLKGWDPRV